MKKLGLLLAFLLIAIGSATIVVSIHGAREQYRPTETLPPSTSTLVSAPAPVEGIYVLPDDGPGPLIEELDAAQESISIEIYLLTDKDVLDALFRARDRGVDVRVLLEEDPYGGSNQQPDVFRTLAEGGIQVRWNSAAQRFSHIKLIVIDQEVALVMNLNLTYSALHRNRELAVITTEPSLVDHATRLFENDWMGKDGEIPGPLVLSPDTSRQAILGLIDGAQTTLDIYAEVITDQQFIAAVNAAIDRGVRVRIVMTRAYGQDLTTEPVAELVRHGAQLRTLADPYIHAKMVLVDGREALIGSQNYTSTSMDQNREAGAIVSVPTNIERLQRTFERDFAMGIPAVPTEKAGYHPASALRQYTRVPTRLLRILRRGLDTRRSIRYCVRTWSRGAPETDHHVSANGDFRWRHRLEEPDAKWRNPGGRVGSVAGRVSVRSQGAVG